MSLALGRTPEDEVRPDIHKLTAHLSNQCGLLFTNESSEDTKK